ncbi:serine/threonine-protein kinase WNK2-like [Hippoglossus hippoglossus]|uniref:serine/threonine-protein kinase WNK2-like n=1 Tax=Hippoglossus hippoglossus TaxID=8267 RepID=UPI00148CC0EB|nr:serine/threonine-protein kinase WNK2-like [Hippoglossus hippoglossus]
MVSLFHFVKNKRTHGVVRWHQIYTLITSLRRLCFPGRATFLTKPELDYNHLRHLYKVLAPIPFTLPVPGKSAAPASAPASAPVAASGSAPVLQPAGIQTAVSLPECASLATTQQNLETTFASSTLQQEASAEDVLQDKPVSLPSYAYDSLNSDVASGKETSDGYDSLASVGKGDGKPRKHHRKSA